MSVPLSMTPPKLTVLPFIRAPEESNGGTERINDHGVVDDHGRKAMAMRYVAQQSKSFFHSVFIIR